jgi:hypothetical protein
MTECAHARFLSKLTLVVSLLVHDQCLARDQGACILLHARDIKLIPQIPVFPHPIFTTVVIYRLVDRYVCMCGFVGHG